MKKRVHVYYNGMVQGVGFRFTVEHLARKRGVKGWVKNLPDGRVELVCEGSDDSLKDLLDDIRGGSLKRYIQNADISYTDATGEFKDFDIRFY